MKQELPKTVEVKITWHLWSEFVKLVDFLPFNGKFALVYPVGSDFPLLCIYHYEDHVFTVSGKLKGGSWDIEPYKILYVSFDPLIQRFSRDHYKF